MVSIIDDETKSGITSGVDCMATNMYLYQVVTLTNASAILGP